MSDGAIRKYPCILAISSQRKQEFRRAESAKSRWGRCLTGDPDKKSDCLLRDSH